MKFGLKYFFEKTPKVLKQIGTAMMAASLFAMTYAIITEDGQYAKWIAIGGIVGKFLTSLFGEQSLNDKAAEKPNE